MTEDLRKDDEKKVLHYELLYLIPNTYTNTELEGIIKKITERIEKDTTITLNQDLGKKRLAYPIKHLTHGSYVVVEFDAQPKIIKELNNDLRLMDEVLRHLIIEKRKRSEEELQEEKKRRAETDRKISEAQEEATAKKPSDPKKETTKVQATPEQIKKEASTDAEKKITIEELDDKLDELLEGKDLV